MLTQIRVFTVNVSKRLYTIMFYINKINICHILVYIYIYIYLGKIGKTITPYLRECLCFFLRVEFAFKIF